MSLITARSVSAAVVVAAVLASASAGAQEGATTPATQADPATAPKAECIGQLDRAQSLQTARKFREARASYVACSAAACPDVLREDCSRSLVELEGAMPTV